MTVSSASWPPRRSARTSPGSPAGAVDPEAQTGRGRLVLPLGRPPRPAHGQPDGQDRHHQGPQGPAPARSARRRGEGAGGDLQRRPRKDVPLDRLRDRVLFETAYVGGARAAEVCGLYVEDLDLRLDDEHVRIHGKGGTVRTGCWTTAATSRCSSCTWPAPAIPPGRCSAPASTDPAGRCPTTPPTTGGGATAVRQGSASTSASCATPTPPS
jgi:hypothetical protein